VSPKTSLHLAVLLMIRSAVALNIFALIQRVLSNALKLILIPKVNVIQLADILFATIIGVVQLEESKKKITKKDHIREAMRFGVSLVMDFLCIRALSPSFLKNKNPKDLYRDII